MEQPAFWDYIFCATAPADFLAFLQRQRFWYEKEKDLFVFFLIDSSAESLNLETGFDGREEIGSLFHSFL